MKIPITFDLTKEEIDELFRCKEIEPICETNGGESTSTLYSLFEKGLLMQFWDCGNNTMELSKTGHEVLQYLIENQK